jgi:hypothetical protein
MKATIIFELEYPDDLAGAINDPFHPAGLAATILSGIRDLSGYHGAPFHIEGLRALRTDEYERLTAALEVRP